jgi:tellurite resistance protein
MVDATAKQLLKILIGTAWLDGKVQPEEQQYLLRIAERKGLLEDPELKPLLYGLRGVKPAECKQWVDDYLGAHPTPAVCQQLLEDISGLIYSDGVVDSSEANLMMEIQKLEAGDETSTDLQETITHAIQKLYRKWMGDAV